MRKQHSLVLLLVLFCALGYNFSVFILELFVERSHHRTDKFRKRAGLFLKFVFLVFIDICRSFLFYSDEVLLKAEDHVTVFGPEFVVSPPPTK